MATASRCGSGPVSRSSAAGPLGQVPVRRGVQRPHLGVERVEVDPAAPTQVPSTGTSVARVGAGPPCTGRRTARPGRPPCRPRASRAGRPRTAGGPVDGDGPQRLVEGDPLVRAVHRAEMVVRVTMTGR